MLPLDSNSLVNVFLNELWTNDAASQISASMDDFFEDTLNAFGSQADTKMFFIHLLIFMDLILLKEMLELYGKYYS